MQRLLIFNFIISCLLFSCKKEKLQWQWKKINVDESIHWKSIHFSDKDTGYIAGGVQWKRAAVLKTTDGGLNWESVYDTSGHNLLDIFAINGHCVFAVNFAGGVIFSNDGGQSWNKIQFNQWSPLHDIYFSDESTGWIAGGGAYRNGYIYSSQNGGLNWKRQEVDRELRNILFVNDQKGFAGSYGGIFTTDDQGSNWELTAAKGDFFLDISFPAEQTGFAVGNQGDIIKTTDGGQSWKKLLHGHNFLIDKQHFRSVFFTDELNGYVAGEDGIILKTADGGDEWERIEISFNNDLESIFIVKDMEGVICGNGAVYYFSENP